MSETLVINTLEQLESFLNENHILEIVLRREKDKKFKKFQKIILNTQSQGKEKELLEKVCQTLDKTTKQNQKNIKLLGQAVRLEQIGFLLNGSNLCATCVGFAIINEKLDQMSEEIRQQIDYLESVVKQGYDVQSSYEFNKILSEHTNMLDSRRRQRPYSEEKMRELVDGEYNVLNMLIQVCQKGIAEDYQSLIFSIFSLLSMLTVSLRYFDEIYYENNHAVLGDENVWHSSHQKWMSVYDTLSSRWFVEKLQDYAMFESELTVLGADAYYVNLIDQVFELKEEVEDNQSLILALGDVEQLHTFQELTNQEVMNEIRDAFTEASENIEDSVVTKLYEDSMKQMAFA